MKVTTKNVDKRLMFFAMGKVLSSTAENLERFRGFCAPRHPSLISLSFPIYTHAFVSKKITRLFYGRFSNTVPPVLLAPGLRRRLQREYTEVGDLPTLVVTSNWHDDSVTSDGCPPTGCVAANVRASERIEKRV